MLFQAWPLARVCPLLAWMQSLTLAWREGGRVWGGDQALAVPPTLGPPQT